MTHKILLLAGDGIGPEIMAQAKKILLTLQKNSALAFAWEEGLIGGAAIEAFGNPLPDATIQRARNSDAILLACVGGPKWDNLPS
ncbi:MAG TPA: isocitrate/isopropylmalate family dehydrogenase, partial [Gammaproteobacteria bacterium]|nr:isocitrate/isopropylmalate family dehydrogenase [Gammaproteobacteria bacterium]